MEFINRIDIDLKKWDDRISRSSIENIFMYSWYLDATCSNWGGLISNDYNTLVPVPFTKKLGIKQMIQAPFTREYDIIGTDFAWREAMSFLSEDFKGVHFRNEQSDLLKGQSTRTHQYLILKDNFSSNYSTNAKRLIKKSNLHFSYRLEEDPKILIEIFKETVWDKIDSIGQTDLENLFKLMSASQKLNQGDLIVIEDENNIVGAGFFLKDKKRITYLKGASFDESKKQGAMYGLLNFAFERYKSKYMTFDFGGSDVESVAAFYKKFGAEDRIYYDYYIDNLPHWFKMLKKIKS